jgi:tetratricopeptide (TPR) repeat protein
MKLTVVVAVLLGMLVTACSTGTPAPTTNIDATVEAKVDKEPGATPAVDTPTPAPTPTLTPTATPAPTLTPTPNAWELETRAAAKTREQAADWFEKGVSFYDKGLHEDAITAFDKAIAISPSEMYYQWRDMSLEKSPSAKLTLLAVCHKILPNEIVPTETCIERMEEGLNPQLSLFYGLEWKGSPDDLSRSDAQVMFYSGKVDTSLFSSFLEQIGPTEIHSITVKLRYPNPTSGPYYVFSQPLSVTVNPSTILPQIDVNPKDTPPFVHTADPGFDWLTPSLPSDFKGLQTDVSESKWTGSDTHPKTRDRLIQTLYLFDATFYDGSIIEVRIDPAIEDTGARSELAEKYMKMVGQLPGFLRSGIKTFSIYKAGDPKQSDSVVASEMDGHINFHSDLAERKPLRLEEYIFHEAVHATLDDFHKNYSQWLAAQQNDGQFISPYAKEFSETEDVAESYSMYYVSRISDPQLHGSIVNTILSTIPNRIKYFDAYAPLPESITTLPDGDLPASVVNCKGSRLEYESKGAKFFDDGDFQNAITQYTKAINLEPDSCDAYYLRGNAYYQQEMYDSAIRDYDMAIQLGSFDADAWYERGKYYHKMKEYKMAISDFDMAISIDSGNPTFYSSRGISYNWLGNGSLVTNAGEQRAIEHNENAISDFTIAIGMDPSDAWVYSVRANSYNWLIEARADKDFAYYRQMIADNKKACSLDSDYC